jgi:hypothetical protein
MDEVQAEALVWKAVEQAGGTRSIYRNPRQAFSAYSRRLMEVDGFTVELRYGEISTPAVATVAGWVYEIHDEEIELLIRPPQPRS